MADFCCDCEYLNREKDYKDWWTGDLKYKCDLCYEYKKLTENACKNFTPIKKSGSYTPSGCYITTIVCEILGYEDNCEILTILRDFRDNTLKTNTDYIPILIQYDQIGPLISEKIQNNPNNYRISLELLNNYLLPCSNLIKNGLVKEAIQLYQHMVTNLINIFEIPYIIIDTNEEYDIENLGKGRIRKNKIQAL